MKKLPTISIITTILNPSLSVFEKVLKSLKKQDYPKRLIEHIVMDGGSNNGAVELAKKYNCKVTERKDLRNHEQIRTGLGIKKARNHLVLVLQSDNIVTSKKWLMEMVEPFLENKKVFCAYSAYNDYKKSDSTTTRYGAFFGAADPVLYYLGKSEKIPLLQKEYDKGKILLENKNYWVVEFNRNSLPTLGDNGTMVLRSAIDKVNIDPKNFVHPDAFALLLDLGYNTCGVIKNSIIHIIPPNMISYAKRRVYVKNEFYDERRGKRKYLVFNWNSARDKINLIKLLFFSLTFFYPLCESIKGYLKIRDKAWFLHPFFLFVMLLFYSKSEMEWLFEKYFINKK